MKSLLLLLGFSLISLAAQAKLLEAAVTSGANRGSSLLATVSKTIPRRAVEEAFAFFDKNEGVERTASVYSIGVDPVKKSFSDYVCGKMGCEIESVKQNLFANNRFMVIFDLNESSLKPRLHIVDLMSGDVTSLYATHGKGSSCAGDPTHACQFISDRDSEASPLGFFTTGASALFAREGWLIPLIGLQGAGPSSSRNDVASTIVIHGAAYASPEFRREHGYMGRSLGCPAVSFSDMNAWKDRLEGGALFYFFHSSLPHESAPISRVRTK